MYSFLYFGAKMVTFCSIHIGNRKIFLRYRFIMILMYQSSMKIEKELNNCSFNIRFSNIFWDVKHQQMQNLPLYFIG